MSKIEKIGLGGGCHWCTEGIFQSLKGVINVEQGWITSATPHDSFSEAVIVHFDPSMIALTTLIEIHLITHSSESKHSMRTKYRSAIYFFNKEQEFQSLSYLKTKNNHGYNFITEVIPFLTFKSNSEEFLNYYQTKPNAPFCKRFISPKLKRLLISHKKHLK